MEKSGERYLRSKLKVERDFSSRHQEYICQNCQKSFFGWAESNICPECGGKLILAKKYKKLILKEN
jgi:rRNA maturation endonuclease Nob1